MVTATSSDPRAEPARDASSPEPGYGDLVRAFQEVGDAILSNAELDPVLHLVIGKLCELLDIRRGSLYLRDPESGLFHGQVGQSSTELDVRVKRLTCGLAADRFTEEILASRAPVFIADAQQDPRPIRSTMREWEVRSILGVPMIAGGEIQGLLFLDDLERPHRFSDEDQQLAAAFANMAAVAITAARRTTELQESVRTITRQNSILRRAAVIDEQLTARAAGGATIRELTATLSELIGRPCAVYDAGLRRIAVGPSSAGDPGSLRLIDESVRREPEVSAALAGAPRSGPVIIGPFPRSGLHRRWLVAPIAARDHAWGCILVSEVSSRLTALDRLAAGRAATLIALHVSMERGAVELEAYAREALVRRLIDDRWPPPEVLEQARLHGIRVDAPHLVAILGLREPHNGFDIAAVEQAAVRAGMPSAWFAQTESDTLTIIIELDGHEPRADTPGDIRVCLQSLVSQLGGRCPVCVAVSDPCASIDELRSGYQQARRVLGLLRTFGVEPRSPTILTAADVGAGALLLADADPSDARRFVRRALGALAEAEDPRSRELLQTVRAYLGSRGIRKAAQALHVHENTIRYRLGRFAELTGLDVLIDTGAQVTAHVALLLLSLEGRLPDADDRVGVRSSSGSHPQRPVETDDLAAFGASTSRLPVER